MTTFRHYEYVGPQELIANLPMSSQRLQVQAIDDLLRWFQETDQVPDEWGYITVTFVIDLHGNLWINHRRSEHVLCAAGQPVLSAGEMTFSSETDFEVVEVTNQSTGYCPEPISWEPVHAALSKLCIPHPPDFTSKCIFRRCENCGTKNIVKDDWYFCGYCDEPLSQTWNFA